MDKRSYKVISPIRFGGRICGIGETVSLTDAEAAQFSGCIEATAPADDAGSTILSGDLQENGKLTARIEELQNNLLELARKLADETGDRDRIITDLRAENEKLNAAVADRDSIIATCNKTIAEITEKVAKLKKVPAGKKQ